MTDEKIIPMNQENGAAELSIVVDDGSRRVPIKNKLGEEVGVFYFRPTDIGIVDRYNQMAEKFNEVTEPLKNVGINPDGTAADDSNPDEIAALNEAEKRLYEMCDFMFGGNMSEAFFGKMHPFSPINGDFYCELAIEAVGNYISAQFETETKKVSKRMSKYTSGYRPGQTRRGK